MLFPHNSSLHISIGILNDSLSAVNDRPYLKLKWLYNIINNRYGGNAHVCELFDFNINYSNSSFNFEPSLNMNIHGSIHNEYRRFGVMHGTMDPITKIGSSSFHFYGFKPEIIDVYDFIDFNKEDTWELIDKLLFFS